MIVIVTGLPGSGKSYFASRLAKMIDAAYINSDRVRKYTFTHSVYTEEEKLAVYEEMLAEMKDAVHRHKQVVLDATFYKKDIREKFFDKAGATGALFLIEVRADEALIKERLKQTRTDSEADFGVYTMIKEKWEPLGESHLILESTDDSINSMLRQALDYLNTKTNDFRADR